ncbi:glycosyltransferase family 4 protein [bacterium]|nr:glycosyltransferase family 4 protein [bacterium]MBU1675327.1 glycosyltransferase family 4 protein [bacterium]
MRILAVNWRDIRDPLGGGAEIHLHEILKRAVSAGHEVDLVVSGQSGAPARETIDGVRIQRRGHWAVANLVLPWVVRRLLRERDFDLLVEDINKIPFYTPLYAGGVPVLAVVPHLFGATVFREANPLLAAYVWAAERPLPRVYRDAAFEVISPSTRDDLIGRGLPAAHVHCVHCGIDRARLRIPDPPPRDDPPLIVSWSRLRRYKSLEVAVRAFARIRETVPGARLMIVGRGPDEGRLRREAARLGLAEAVAFAGYLDESALAEVLHRARLFLNPSPKEGWGLTVIEANACGLPVVASDRPGLRDSVRDGETGLLVPYGDHAAMADAALSLLTDGVRWRTFSEAARAWSSTFDWDRCADESLALFAEVAKRPGGRRS